MRKKIIMGLVGLSILLMSGCTSTKTTEDKCTSDY